MAEQFARRRARIVGAHQINCGRQTVCRCRCRHAQTDESGNALYGNSGTIVGSSLEGSNTDIADEFTKLIVTQQAYSANTKVITTSTQMVQDLLNVVR